MTTGCKQSTCTSGENSVYCLIRTSSLPASAPVPAGLTPWPFVGGETAGNFWEFKPAERAISGRTACTQATAVFLPVLQAVVLSWYIIGVVSYM